MRSAGHLFGAIFLVWAVTSIAGAQGQPANPLAAPANPLAPPAAARSEPVRFTVYHYVDKGGIRDQDGQFMEAFTMLVPKDWKFTGGLRWVTNEKRPDQLSKTDVLNPVKSDFTVTSPDGRCVVRQYPVEYWVDTSRSPMSLAAGLVPGTNYNGMMVTPVVDGQQYLQKFVLPTQRKISDFRLVSSEELPALAEKFSAESDRFNKAMAGAGPGGNLSFKAGTVTIDYDDQGLAMRETFVSVIQYIDTSGLVMFWPRCNFSVRAPADRFDSMRSTFTTMVTGLQTNPRWSVELINLRQHARMGQREADDYCNRVQQEIRASHDQTNRELARGGGYLSADYHPYKGTDGRRYYLPTDKYHFMNKDGELLSQDSSVPPSSEWTSIEPYNQ